ncbi:hypothetical protein LMANV2_100059 [Leptospira interrogans serovar Manilae]|uniref:Uncharacterized protein n=1 Tax=Leptospira interrogans serovar Manilae TaxID=214675 RepID=A0AAQ1SMB1_LEPIR|nr:hypothetical protein LMANV2_100059 [Leptospira interrogans serovar Manilae]
MLISIFPKLQLTFLKQFDILFQKLGKINFKNYHTCKVFGLNENC